MATSTPNMLALDLPLPIIISDWDAAQAQATSTVSADTKHIPSSSGSITTTATSSPIERNWNTGFSDFADDLWRSMTASMKQKLRDACVEVLRKTEDTEKDGRMSWEYDDDARFLD